MLARNLGSSLLSEFSLYKRIGRNQDFRELKGKCNSSVDWKNKAIKNKKNLPNILKYNSQHFSLT